MWLIKRKKNNQNEGETTKDTGEKKMDKIEK
jgi:hypothetical protein